MAVSKSVRSSVRSEMTRSVGGMVRGGGAAVEAMVAAQMWRSGWGDRGGPRRLVHGVADGSNTYLVR